MSSALASSTASAVASATTSSTATTSGLACQAAATKVTILTALSANAGLVAGLAVVFVFVSWAILISLFRLCIDELAIRSFKTWLWFVFLACLCPRLVPRPDDEGSNRLRMARNDAKRELAEARAYERERQRTQSEGLVRDKQMQQALRKEREADRQRQEMQEREAKEAAKRRAEEQAFGSNEAGDRAFVRAVTSTVGGLSPVRPPSPESVGRPNRRFSDAEVRAFLSLLSCADISAAIGCRVRHTTRHTATATAASDAADTSSLPTSNRNPLLKSTARPRR